MIGPLIGKGKGEEGRGGGSERGLIGFVVSVSDRPGGGWWVGLSVRLFVWWKVGGWKGCGIGGGLEWNAIVQVI